MFNTLSRIGVAVDKSLSSPPPPRTTSQISYLHCLPSSHTHSTRALSTTTFPTICTHHTHTAPPALRAVASYSTFATAFTPRTPVSSRECFSVQSSPYREYTSCTKLLTIAASTHNVYTTHIRAITANSLRSHTHTQRLTLSNVFSFVCKAAPIATALLVCSFNSASHRPSSPTGHWLHRHISTPHFASSLVYAGSLSSPSQSAFLRPRRLNARAHGLPVIQFTRSAISSPLHRALALHQHRAPYEGRFNSQQNTSARTLLSPRKKV